MISLSSVSLIGPRSQSISVSSRNQMYEIAGYMARPGRLSSIEAEVPCDYREIEFKRLFPGQVYRPITIGDTPSGRPNKYSPQFRINFANIRNCPEPLRQNLGVGNGSCVSRVNKSRFVLDMVLNYGFQFGFSQNVVLIRKIAEDNGCLSDFEHGFSR